MKFKLSNIIQFVYIISAIVNLVFAAENKLNRSQNVFREPRVVYSVSNLKERISKIDLFTDDVLVSSAGDQFSPHLACLSSGEIYLAFYTSDSIINVMNSTDGGETWYQKFSIYWGERGASISELNLSVSEGDSICLFLSHVIFYSGVDVSQIVVYRLNLVTGASGFRFVKEHLSPVIPTSPHVTSDSWDSTNYRVRVVWLAKGGINDTIYYANSLDQGWSWSEQISAYVDAGGGIANLSVSYGNGEWWMAWDKGGDIFVRNLFSGNPKNITHTPYTHYRPVIAIAGNLNASAKTSIAVTFVRRWSQYDLGAYYVSSDNSGQNWGPIYVVGTDLTSTSDFNPYVSYSKTLDRFYYTLITQDSLGLPSQSYRISSYYANNDIPDQMTLIEQQVNDDTVYGSGKADPVILGNPSRGGEPMLAWRHWSGTGQGKIMFDAQYRLPDDVSSMIEAPTNFKLYQAYPNPFNPTTKIQYSVASRQYVSLKVYDILGREVATLVNEHKQPGNYEVEWDASRFASGVYFYKMTAEDFVDMKKVLLIR